MANVKTIFPLAYKVMDDYAKSVVKEMITRLTNAGHIATGDLAKSLDYKIEIQDQELQLYFIGNDYGQWVDKGRKPGGKLPPISKIKEWTKLKGIDESAAYPIAKSISIKGIAPTNFYTISTTRRVKEFEKNFYLALKQDMINEINKPIK